MSEQLTIITAAEQVDLLPQINQLAHQSFTRFFFEGDHVVAERWEKVLEQFKKFQFALFEGKEVVGGGITIPLTWDGTVDHLPQSPEELYPTDPGEPNVLCALVPKKHQGRGISPYILHGMKAIAKKHGFISLIAPVYPHHKSRYPLVPMERYAQWKREDGLPYDPWIRVHWRLGGKILKVMPRASIVQGTVQQWEEWTGMYFPESGIYVTPETIAPVTIDVEKNEGIYIEPNVWMEHELYGV